MICNYKAIGEIGYIFHHAAAVYAYYFVIVSVNSFCQHVCILQYNW